MDNKNIAAIVKSLQNFSVNAEKLLSTKFCEESHLINLDYDDSFQLDFDVRLKKEEFLSDSATQILRKCENIINDASKDGAEGANQTPQTELIESMRSICSIMMSFKNSVGDLNCDNRVLKNSLKSIKIMCKAIIAEANRDNQNINESSLAA